MARFGMWLRAFRGFYNPKSDLKNLDTVSKWLFASRSVILIISMQTAIISGILAFASGKFNAFYFILVFIGFVLAHAASNLTNDYFGFAKGHDSGDAPRLNYTIHPLVSGLVTRKELRRAILLIVFAGFLIAAYLTIVRGPLIAVFFSMGIAFLVGYDVSPVTLKEIGLGEIATFVIWGPLMVGSGYYIITGSLSVLPFLIGIPYGFGVMSILVGKHIDQMGFDRRIGQHTLPLLLGSRIARKLNVALICSMYIAVALLVLGGLVPLLALLVFFNLPNAVRAVRTLSRPKPAKAPKGYIGWPLWYHKVSLIQDRNFGWLYIAGLSLGSLLFLALH